MLLYHPQKYARSSKLDDFLQSSGWKYNIIELPVPRFFLGRIFFVCVCMCARPSNNRPSSPTHFTISHRDATIEQPQNRVGKTTKKTEKKKIRGWKISLKTSHIAMGNGPFEDVCPTSNDFFVYCCNVRLPEFYVNKTWQWWYCWGFRNPTVTTLLI